MNESRFFPKTDAIGVIPRPDRTAWLKGGKHRCQMPPRTPVGQAWRIILFGAPGVDMETQAELLRERLGVCRLSISDIFRSAASSPERELTPAVQNALDYLKRGESVPDETILSMVGERLGCLHCSGGFLLDGFPRTVAQAKALEQLLESHDIRLTAVLNYELPQKQAKSNVCNNPVGAENPNATERTEVAVHEQFIQPLVDFYQSRGLLINIDAKGTAEEVYRRTRLSALAI